LPATAQGCFRHCGSSTANIATFDPRSGQRDSIEGTLFYFVVPERALPLSFTSFDPQSSGAGVKAG
jgi:hypothetical protein